jgi:hypothetical protein
VLPLFPIIIESALKEFYTATNTVEFNFDTTSLNLPRTVKGSAWISLYSIQDSNAAGTDFIFRLYKST